MFLMKSEMFFEKKYFSSRQCDMSQGGKNGFVATL